MSSRKSRHDKHRRTSGRRQMPLWALFVLHAMALGIALVVYALPHHVIPRAGEAIGTVSTREMMVSVHNTATVSLTPAPETFESPAGVPEEAVTPESPAWEGAMTANATAEPIASTATPDPEVVETTPEPTGTPEPTEEPPQDEVGSFRIKFADKFAEGKTKKTKTTYKSKNLNIKISTVKNKEWDAVYHVVDIYVADISCFRTCFAQGKYGSGYTAWPLETTREFNAVITMNGDYYGVRKSGVVIRNGKLYRNAKVTNDVCVLYWDGTMKTFSPRSFEAEREMKNGAYQCWNFGPMLLDENGKAMTKFNSDVLEENPRSVVGYFEPGHYCFVAVDGRSKDSDGLSMKRLAKLMESLGCKQAYNLDGGRTSMLYAGDTRINVPVEGGRKSSDFLMIVDKVTK